MKSIVYIVIILAVLVALIPVADLKAIIAHFQFNIKDYVPYYKWLYIPWSILVAYCIYLAYKEKQREYYKGINWFVYYLEHCDVLQLLTVLTILLLFYPIILFWLLVSSVTIGPFLLMYLHTH